MNVDSNSAQLVPWHSPPRLPWQGPHIQSNFMRYISRILKEKRLETDE